MLSQKENIPPPTQCSPRAKQTVSVPGIMLHLALDKDTGAGQGHLALGGDTGDTREGVANSTVYWRSHQGRKASFCRGDRVAQGEQGGGEGKG